MTQTKIGAHGASKMALRPLLANRLRRLATSRMLSVPAPCGARAARATTALTTAGESRSASMAPTTDCSRLRSMSSSSISSSAVPVPSSSMISVSGLLLLRTRSNTCSENIAGAR